MDSKQQMLRHFVATLEYRGRKILNDMPEDIPVFRPEGAGPVRSSVEILEHVNQVLGLLQTLLSDQQLASSQEPGQLDWTTERERFFDILGGLDRLFTNEMNLSAWQ